MNRGWTQTDYQNKHYNMNQKDKGTQDGRGRDGGTNFILRIKEQETCLTLQEHDDDEVKPELNFWAVYMCSLEQDLLMGIKYLKGFNILDSQAP